MPTSQSRRRALLALCLASGVAARTGAETIEYREAWGYGVVVPVRIQGLGPFEFLLDTGTDVTVVRSDLARRLGLVATSRVELVTVGGQQLVSQAPLSGMQLGTAQLGPMAVLIHDMAAARGREAHLAGMLGRDALAGLRFTIDHARRRIRLGGPKVEGGVTYTEEQGRPVIEARLRCAGERIRLVLDSGAPGLVLFEGTRSLSVATPDRITATTNLGAVTLRAGRLDALCLGSARLHDVRVAVQRRQPGDTRIEDGILPTSLFARVQFDGRQKRVRLEPW
jgi:predicted aspartyl protease